MRLTYNSHSLPACAPVRALGSDLHMAGLGFPETHWTLIVRAQGSEEHKRAAIDEIARNYRLPLLRYARARGFPTDRAEDLVQSAFERLLSNDFVGRLDQQRGRLRGFLKAALDHEILHSVEKEKALRRGGAAVTKSIQELEPSDEPSGGARPDDLYERAWAQAIARRAMNRLESEMVRESALQRWPTIRMFLSDETSLSYVEAATRAGITVAQFRVGLHRARRRFQELLRHEIQGTLDNPGEVASEEKLIRARILG